MSPRPAESVLVRYDAVTTLPVADVDRLSVRAPASSPPPRRRLQTVLSLAMAPFAIVTLLFVRPDQD